MSSNQDDLTLTQVKKLRRRIEEFLRQTRPEILIQIADKYGVKVPKNLRNRYVNIDSDDD